MLGVDFTIQPIQIKDIAWLSGLLEGEGCFAAYKGLATIKLNMTDEDVVARAALLLGVHVTGPYVLKNPKYKPHYHANLFGNRAAAWMMTLYPFLGKRRQEKIREVLAVWQKQPKPGSHNSSKTHCPQGHAYTEDNAIIRINGSRHCRSCIQMRKRADYRRQNPEKCAADLAERRKKYHVRKGHTYYSLEERKVQIEPWQIKSLISDSEGRLSFIPE